MKQVVASILILLMLLTPALASGQDYTRYRLPEGQRCTVSGETYQCFNLHDYTELLHIDDDLRSLTFIHADDVVRTVALTHASDELQLAVTAASQQVTLLTAERVRLTTLWQETDRQLREAQNRPDWSWIPWSLAAAFAVTTLVLGLILGLQR